MMQYLVRITAICLALVFISIIGQNSLAFAQIVPFFNKPMAKQNKTFETLGAIASLQNNSTSKPTWLVTGYWNMSIPVISGALSQSNQSNVPDFKASLTMIKLDGTERHTHTISDFRIISGPANKDIKSPTFTGTATITLKDGPHNNVPIALRLLNNGVISITPDPTKVSGHFGNTPLYGTVWKSP
jgi:hypothetical protein